MNEHTENFGVPRRAIVAEVRARAYTVLHILV